ncbi:MAG: transposase [Proteobacteria bacterium]|nr:transposase [Pseudomonadota bacterium]MCP4283827.1 transposase [Gammaproteobacteria bacterium]
MNSKTQYTEAFRQQALQKVYARGSRSVISIAEELNLNHWTLKNWMKPKSKPIKQKTTTAKRPNDWTPAERLGALMTTHSMDDQSLGHYCRSQGIFTHHLKQWRTDFESGTSSSSSHLAELRDLKSSHKNLQSELKRKEKALAEAAALLVLQKKFQALWEDEAE